MKRALLISLCLCSGVLTGCVKSSPTEWRVATPRDKLKLNLPGQTTLKGSVRPLGLNWNDSAAVTEAKLGKLGLRLGMVRQSPKRPTTELYRGQLQGRDCRVIILRQGRIQRVQVHWQLQDDIDSDYQSMIKVLNDQLGHKGLSLYTPSPPTDRLYRAAAGRKLPPMTGWVYASGDAVSLSITQPYRAGGDTSAMMELSYDSRDYRIAVGTFTGRDN